MRKKILPILLIVLALSCSLLGVVSCKKKHKHEYVARTAIASCTTEGYTEYICSCGDSYRENGEPAHHILTYVDAVNATCTEDGHAEYYECSNCSKLFSDESGENEITDYSIIFIPAKHTITYVAEQSATCTEEGHLAYYECSICDKWFNDEKGQIEINNHDDMFIPAGHTITYVDEQFATCTEEGHLAYYGCIACDKWFSDEKGQYEITDHSSISIPATHTLTFVNEKPATCIEKGHSTYYECDICDKWFSDESGKTEISNHDSVMIATLAHTLNHVNEKPASCTEEGHSAYYECSICDKWFNDEFGKDEITDKQSTVASILEHKLTFVPEKPATGLEAGHIAYYECTECVKWFIDEHAKNEITDKENDVTIKAHIITFVPEKTATCIEKGNIAYYECSDCHKYFSDINGVNEIIDKESVMTNILPHTLSYVLEEPATCTEEGHSDYYECEICDKWFEGENGVNEITNKNSLLISILPHTVILVPEQSASLTIDGHSAYYECEECKKWFSDEKAENEIIDKNSVIIEAVHKLTLVLEQSATCTENGNIAYYICSKCDKWFSDKNAESEITDKSSVVAPATHAMTFVPEKSATCAEKGNISYYECSICTKWFDDVNGQNEITDKNSVITTNPHNYVESICTVCGSKKPTVGLEYTKYNNEYVIVSGIGTATDTDIVIAEEYDGLPVKMINYNAFKDHSELTSVTIPVNITKVGQFAFNGCTGLTRVYYTGTIDQWAQIDFSGYSSNPLSYASNLYINNQLLTNANIVNATSIKAYVFSNCSGLTRVEIGKSVTSIGSQAFNDCTGLTSITIPESVTSIEKSAFYNCSSLTSITIPNSVTNIGDSAFEDCSGLTNVIIGEGVSIIGKNVFKGCKSLESITLPFVGSSKDAKEHRSVFGYIFGYTVLSEKTQSINATLQYIDANSGDFYFYYYYIPTSLKSVTITGGNIGYNAFNNCSGLTSVALLDGVTSIGESAFSFCTGLTRINIPNSVISIGNSAFSFCSGLISITIPDSVMYIEQTVFYRCSGLTSVTFGNSVTYIGDGAFYQCTGLTSVYYKGSESEWNAIRIGSNNDNLADATKYFYSETEPTVNGDGTAYNGNYWHYDVDGNIVVWKKQ